jgi:hypothetical protein
MAEGYDPAEERERLESTVDDDRGGGEIRRYYVKTATQDWELVAVVVEAAPGSYLYWSDIEELTTRAKKVAGAGSNKPPAASKATGNGRRKQLGVPVPKKRTTVKRAKATPSGNGRRRRKTT